ncbi:MAG: TRAP transporter substrate-binding protein DctP, partial [Nitrospinae bacterium]|nr:TRAP transporter substrate-binding protein DctP [Nitrospinota bacterium]
MRTSEPRRGFLCLWAWITTLAVGLSLTASPAHARRRPRPRHQIKFATLAPEGSTWMKIMRQLDAELYERTGGELGFKIYAGMVQGDEKDVLRKIRIGQLHAGGAAAVRGYVLLDAIPVLLGRELGRCPFEAVAKEAFGLRVLICGAFSLGNHPFGIFVGLSASRLRVPVAKTH